MMILDERGDALRTPVRRAIEYMATRVLAGIETALGALCALLLAVLLAVVLVAVAQRYLLGGSFLGSDEVAIWLHVGLVGVGAPLAAGSALAMRLDFFTRAMPPAAQAAAILAADAITVLGGLILCFAGGTVMAMIGGTSPVLGLPEWARFAPVVAGGALTVAVIALRTACERGIGAAAAAAALGAALFGAASLIAVPSGLAPSLVMGLAAAFGLIVGAPLPHAFLAGAYLAIPFGSTMPAPAIVATTVAGIAKFLLLAIPCFLLAGRLLTAGGLAERLVRFAAALVGHYRGGLAQTTLLTGVLFSGASGSSIANAAFGAATFVPALIARGHAPPRAAALVAATSMLDNIIPPSIAFLILAAATNLSVGSLFVGGFLAGAVLALALALAIHLTATEKATDARASPAERRAAAAGALPAFGLGIIVVLGIRFGIVTTTEAAALAAFYSLLAGAGLGGVGSRGLYRAFRQAAAEASAVGLLIGASAPIAFLLAVDQVSASVTSFATALGGGAAGVMLLANLVLLVAGLFLDIGAAILLFGPMLLPAAVAAGIDPIHFGVILVVNLMIHGLMPPVGILVYVVSGIARVPAAAVFRSVLPFLAALLAALALLAAAAAVAPYFAAP